MPITIAQTVIDDLCSVLNTLDPKMPLVAQELFLEHDKASLKPQGSYIVAGVSLELPQGFTAADLLEAFRIGERNCIAILEALVKMEATSSRPDRRFALDEALDRVADFSKIMVGIHCSGSPDNMNLSAERIVEVMEASADAIRYAQHKINDCEVGNTDHLEFLQERLEAHEKLNHEFGLRHLKSIGKEYCEVKL